MAARTHHLHLAHSVLFLELLGDLTLTHPLEPSQGHLPQEAWIVDWATVSASECLLGQLLSAKRTLAISGGIFVVRTGVLLAFTWIEARGAVRHPPTHRIAPTTGSVVNSAKTEKQCHRFTFPVSP